MSRCGSEYLTIIAPILVKPGGLKPSPPGRFRGFPLQGTIRPT